MATRPGVNDKFGYHKFPAKDLAVVGEFAKHFYVTRALNPVNIHNSEYRAFLMRPADDAARILGIEQEIVVAFADYANFEVRTMSAFDSFIEQCEEDRIDRSIRFIISGDSEIDKSIQLFLSNKPEYPIVVPYKYTDFTASGVNMIFSRIRENFIVRDLFGYQSPLRQEYFFFGRIGLVNQIIDNLKVGQNTGLFGLRKSGKTSTIYAIQRRAKIFGARAVVFDCQDPAVHGRTVIGLLSVIVNECRKRAGFKEVSFDESWSLADASSEFRRHMLQTLSEMRSNILLVFDEIENISPNSSPSSYWRNERNVLSFWQILRSFFQGEYKYKISFCFVGTNPHLFEIPKLDGVDNPLFLFTSKHFIEPFNFEETQKMCSNLGYFMGINFDPKIMLKIQDAFGGHPFFTRQLCSKLHQKLPKQRPCEISNTIFEDALSDTLQSLRPYIQDILTNLKNFYPEEFDMLNYLAKGELDTFTKIAAEYPELVEHLLGYGLVVNSDDGYEFRFDQVKKVIIAAISEGAKSASISMEEKWSEISSRRNRLEQDIRSYLYFFFNGLDHSSWEQLSRECIFKTIERLGPLSPRDIFSRGKSPLYWIDLMKFSFHQLGPLAKNTNSSNLKSAFDTVNKMRVEAHALDIADDAFDEWKKSIQVLEDYFVPPS